MLEKLRSDINQPFWINSTHFSHILLACKYQLMIHHPIWILIENCRPWVNENCLVINQCSIAIFSASPCCMRKKSSWYGLSYLPLFIWSWIVLIMTQTWYDRQSKSLQNHYNLLSNISSALQPSHLNEILMTPFGGVLVVFPLLIDS